MKIVLQDSKNAYYPIFDACEPIFNAYGPILVDFERLLTNCADSVRFLTDFCSGYGTKKRFLTDKNPQDLGGLCLLTDSENQLR